MTKTLADLAPQELDNHVGTLAATNHAQEEA